MITPDEEATLRLALKEDFTKYAPRCLKLRPKAGGLTPFHMNEGQTKIHKAAEAQKGATGKVRVLVLKARQWGCSTYVEGRFYHQITHRRGVKGFVLTHRTDATENLFAMTERFHNNCPDPLRPITGASNKRELEFEYLDSRFEVNTAGAAGVGRSDTIQYLHGSEVAYWPNADDHVDGLLQAVPDEEGTEVWLESTANGPAGIFYNMCQAALKGQGDFIIVFVAWHEHGEYSEDPPEDWVCPADFADYQELHSLNNRQIYWAWKKSSEFAIPSGASLDAIHPKFRQEYPATVQEAFQTTTNDVIIKPMDVLRARKNERAPDPSAPILLGVDIARGGGDLTRILDRQGRRIGKLANDVLDSDDLMHVTGWVAKWIRKVKADHVFVDATGLGSGVYDRLIELGYSNVTGVNFGANAEDDHIYANKRVEMWIRLNKWLTAPGDAPDVPDEEVLQSHFCSALYKFDSRSRWLLQPKEIIKKEFGFSPDYGDAAALTFAEIIAPKDEHLMMEDMGHDDMAELYEPNL